MPKYNSDKDQQSSSSNILNSPEKPAFENAGLAFVYKSLINRDPSKRRIKPVESILSMDDDLDDSESDDSDYKPTKLEVDDVEIESDADEQSKNNDEECNNNESSKTNSKTANKIKSKLKRKNNNQKKKKSNDDDGGGGGSDKVIDLDEEESNSCQSDNIDDDSSDSGSDSDSQESNISNEDESKSDEDNQMLNNTSILKNDSSDIQYENQTKTTELELISKYKKILICAVCLGEVSQSDNEIVECDACGISVHELCYGITADDAESIHSDASSASTEPWFCDPCKADVKNPLCELCPNSGGIYKITDKGRWVHMVCALYTLGITFTDTEKLRGPILSGINYNNWGSKNCKFCEDIRFSQTGVCICCDAGMCKTYFHVTCAQREGLLVELPHADDVDPYIAYCRLHSDRKAVKKKRRNYYALAAKFRLLMKNQLSSLKVEDSINNQRTLNKLFTQRRKFQKNFQIHESTDDIIPIPRLLDASPSAMRRLTNRCELAGFNCNPKSSLIYADLMDIRRKWYIQPAFSVEFISYYMDRDERITKMQSESQELLKQNNKLKVIESDVFAKYNMLMKKNEQMKSLNETARSKIRHYLSVLSSFNIQNISSPLYSSSSSSLLSSSFNSSVEDINRIKTLKLGQKILNLPEMQGNYCDKVINPLPISNTIKNSKGASKKEFLLNECTTCKKSKEQHLMALCDSCNLYYHLYCLDPPLRRMPKKTRFGGWQCSNCTENEENEMEDLNKSESQNGTLSSNNDDSTATSDIQLSSNTSNKRKLRENPKAVSKYADLDEFSNTPIVSSNHQTKKSNSRSQTKSKKNKNSTLNTANNNSNSNNNNNKVNSLKNKPRSRKSRTGTSEILTSTSKSGTNSRRSVSPINTVLNNTSRKRKLSNSSENMLNGDSNLISPGNTPNKILSSKRPSQISCYVCKKEVKSPKQTIRCDICGNDFHLSCLKPSCNKSPKRRGYTWCCFVCESKKDQKRSEVHINLGTSNKNNELSENEHSEEKSVVQDGKTEVELKNTNCEVEILKSESKSKFSKKSEIDRAKKTDEQESKVKQEPEKKAESIIDKNSSLPVNENAQTNIYDINTVINDIIMLEEEAQNNNSIDNSQEKQQKNLKDNLPSSSND